MLALFAMLLGAVIRFLPAPSDDLGILNLASLCSPGGSAPDDHLPGPVHTYHNCPCCLIHKVSWAAIVPSSDRIAPPVFVAAEATIARDRAPTVVRPITDSRPRAPPFAA